MKIILDTDPGLLCNALDDAISKASNWIFEAQADLNRIKKGKESLKYATQEGAQDVKDRMVRYRDRVLRVRDQVQEQWRNSEGSH